MELDLIRAQLWDRELGRRHFQMNHLLEDDEPLYPVHKALLQRFVGGAVEHAYHLKERITVPVSRVRWPHSC